MYLIRVLTEGGLTFGDIEAVNTTIPEGIAGVVSGVIDAAVISAGQEASLVADGTARVSHSGFDADKSVYYEPFVLIGRTEFYTANRETAVAIQKGLLKAKDWARAHPDEYFRLHSERSGNPLEVVLATAEYDFDVSTPLNLDNQYVDSLKKIEVFLRTNNLISGSVDFDQWVDDYAAVQALKEYTGEK
jgi:sulfonate transport system substrate-binding protein